MCSSDLSRGQTSAFTSRYSIILMSLSFSFLYFPLKFRAQPLRYLRRCLIFLCQVSIGEFPGKTAAHSAATMSRKPSCSNQDSSKENCACQIMTGLGSNAPSFPFPPFTGDNPNLWITLAEQYFHMLAIHESFWVPMSILHFSGAAGIWLQSVRKKNAVLDWSSFTSLLCTRFGRDRHQLLIRQFYTIKQT